MPIRKAEPAHQNQLRHLRERAGLTQADVAMAINRSAGSAAVSADAVGRWERGEVLPQPRYRRRLAEVFGVSIADLHLDTSRPSNQNATPSTFDPTPIQDSRVATSQQQWRMTRRSLNEHRLLLSRTAASLYPREHQLEDSGLITNANWIPSAPVDLQKIELRLYPDASPPTLTGSEPASAHVRPLASLTQSYSRYTQAVRDLDRPRLFENRAAWRLTGLRWTDDGGWMEFAPTAYYAAVDVNEVVAHELALVQFDRDGQSMNQKLHASSLPYRRLINDPFALDRRPVMPAVSTLMIRAGAQPSFVLHHRDLRSVAMAGGTLQVIPSGIFQPSSVLPGHAEADFSLIRNIWREAAEELMGFDEADGDGQPVDYEREPFATLDRALSTGHIRLYCLGVAMDALTLVGEILTVAIVDPGLFDTLAHDFVAVNDEGTVADERIPFTNDAVRALLDSQRLAPAGAGCISLAWQHRRQLLGVPPRASAVTGSDIAQNRR